jgi:hypothetical protein
MPPSGALLASFRLAETPGPSPHIDSSRALRPSSLPTLGILSHRDLQHIVSAALLVRIPLVSPTPRSYSYFHSSP